MRHSSRLRLVVERRRRRPATGGGAAQRDIAGRAERGAECEATRHARLRTRHRDEFAPDG
ncbi:hypothetical protein ACMA1D_07065 [Streptomyces sp. 796.1]